LFFGAFETFKRILPEKTGLKSGFLIDFYSGFLAECVSCMLWVPIDVVKERLQIQNELKIYQYKNSIDAFKQIISKEGVIGLYWAYGATVMAFGPFLGLNLSLFSKIKNYLKKDDPTLGPFKTLFSATITGMISSIVTNPFEVPKIWM
jgi:hypothetical protein